jgi:hypothetical protein
MTTARNTIGPKIELGHDFVRIDDLVVQNQVLLQILSEKSIAEQIETLETIIKFGVETYRLFGTTATSESIEKVGEKISINIAGTGDALIKDVKGIAAQIVASSGELSVRYALDAWRTEFSNMLTSKFDPENRASILSQFDDLIEKKSKDQNAEIINRLDFNIPTSAINMLQKNLNDHVTTQLGQLSLKVEEITTNLARSEQAKLDKKVQASRGTDFEDALFEVVASFAHIKSDIADNPGKQKKAGHSDNDEGDITVEISSADAHGDSVSFVWEGKLRKDTLSAKRCIEELEKGMLNRGSKVGIIAVEKFSGLSIEMGDVFKELKENMAVLVLDPTDIDINAVRLAYLWARWKCLVNVGSAVDTALVTHSINALKQSSKAFATLRNQNSQVVKLIGANGSLLTLLETQIMDELGTLSQAIDEVNEAESGESE